MYCIKKIVRNTSAYSHSVGFTLIELMIVVATISVVTAVAVPKFKSFQLVAARGVAYANVVQIQKRLITLYDSEGFLPNSSSNNSEAVIPIADAGAFGIRLDFTPPPSDRYEYYVGVLNSLAGISAISVVAISKISVSTVSILDLIEGTAYANSSYLTGPAAGKEINTSDTVVRDWIKAEGRNPPCQTTRMVECFLHKNVKVFSNNCSFGNYIGASVAGSL